MSKSDDAKRNVLQSIKKIDLDPLHFEELDGTITKRSNYHSIDKVCVITEDRGNGFQFIKSYLYFNYPEIAGIMIGLPGNGGFRYILEEYDDYETYILILDKGVTKTIYNELVSTIKHFKSTHANARIYIFQPNSLEEILISFYKLDEYIQLNECDKAKQLMGQLRSVLQGNTNDVDYTDLKTISLSTPEKICENLIYELTKGTPFECYHGQKKIKGVQPYIPAYMSPCWRCQCCTVKEYDSLGKINKDDCKKPEIGNKTDYIAKYSLLSGLTYIIDKIYGFRFHHEEYWNNMSISYFNNLVKEM